MVLLVLEADKQRGSDWKEATKQQPCKSHDTSDTASHQGNCIKVNASGTHIEISMLASQFSGRLSVPISSLFCSLL